jgi:hypothetical protein
MTLRSLINFGQSLKYVAGINVKMLDDNACDISYCILRREKDIVSIDKYETAISSMSSLEEKLKNILVSNAQIHINIEGRGILTKVSEIANDTFNRVETIRKLFPIIKAEDFTIQNYTVGGSVFFHALRNDLFEKFKTLAYSYSIVSISMGPFVVAPLASILHKEVLDFDDYKVSFHNDKISKLELSQSRNFDIAIGETSLPAKAILAYASAWNVLIGNPDLKVSPLPWVDEAVGKTRFNKALYFSARAGLMIVLAVLVINSFLNFWLQSETDNLVIQAAQFSGKKSERDVQYKKLSSLTSVYNTLGWESNQIPVYYGDQIGQSVPVEIQLTLLEIGVVKADVLRKEKKYVFQNNIINVKGFSQTPIHLKQWVDKLETLDWVKTISDQKYQYDNKQGRGLFEFYIYMK